MTRPAPPAAPAPNRRTFALFVLGVLAFTVYGSLVPFEFRSRPWGEAVDSFLWAMRERARPESRSDAVVNVMLGVPLGFGLLGLVCVDRCGRTRAVLRGVLLWPACVAVAAAVEFAQLFVPVRTCAGSDVLCQGLGSALGMAAWVLLGPWLTTQARAVWGGARIGGAAGRLLVGYLVLLAFVQLLPMDLTASPVDVYKKLRDEAVTVPFGEFHGVSGRQGWVWLVRRIGLVGGPDRAPELTPGPAWAAAVKLLKVFGLYVPAGLLAAGLPGRFWARPGRVALAAVALGCGMEALQLIVHSRVPSATDALAGAAGALAGWAVARTVGPSFALVGSLRFIWALVLLVAYWAPFDFRGLTAPFDWIPGMPLESGNPLYALEEFITKAVLFAPLGVVVAAGGAGSFRLGVAALAGAGVSLVIELGQLFLPAHTPCITDVLLGGFGAFAGVWVARRVRGTDIRAGNLRPGVY